MRLLIIRHGKAEDDAPSGLDADRALAAKGRGQAAWLGERLRGTDLAPVAILSSPLTRAKETARLIAAPLGLEPREARELAPSEPVSDVLDLIAARAGDDPLALVGHNPQLAQLAAVLLIGPAGGSVELHTGEALVLELDPRHPIGAARLADRLRRPKD